MQISPEDKTWIGIFSTWIAGVVAGTKAYTSLTGKVESNSNRLTTVEKEFVTLDGETRLMSHSTHKKICEEGRRLADEKMKAIEYRLNKNEEGIASIVKDIIFIKQLMSSVDAKLELLLNNRMEGGRRSYDK